MFAASVARIDEGPVRPRDQVTAVESQPTDNPTTTDVPNMLATAIEGRFGDIH
ncbi:flagellar motor protein MotD [Anopheles sinensis]|uniref:Flagellar motor protein MotD n=1 Tax=Anopheles sinensis TaxID=74873 RepID=A0A084W774_ANOSI|nr:flagellar motor protein MotD [Anopheles sinensis]